VRLDVRNPVIAVLPLANETGDPASDYLAAGVADSLVTSLASFPAVTTLSRAMVAEARARDSTPSAIARDLGATLLVDGTVQRQDDKLSIAISLVWPDGRIAWREAAEGPARDVFAIQARLASALVSALSVQMSADDEARLETPPTSNANALDAYWRGRALLERRDTPGNLQLAEVAFREALRLDARFVDAHVALSETYWELYNTTRDRRWVPQAQQESATVLALAPDVAAVRLALGITLTNSGRYGEAVQELQRALAIRPNDDEARRYLGKALAAADRTDEAVAEWRKALTIRPNNWQALSDMGRALFGKGRLAEAEATYRQLVALNPDNVIGHQGLGTVLHRLKRIPEALESYERATAITPAAQTLSNMGTLYYERREYGKAVEAYRRAIAIRPNSAPTHRNLGDLLTQLGRQDEALAAYQRAVELAEAAREVNPADAQNLAELAVYTVKTGRIPDALGYAAEATRLTPEAPAVWWLASHVYALAGRPEPALDALSRALAMGRAKADAREAQELASLHGHPAFQRLVAE
jgi:tetratricopeptide (TPR) repeat protein/TolB-like protein